MYGYGKQVSMRRNEGHLDVRETHDPRLLLPQRVRAQVPRRAPVVDVQGEAVGVSLVMMVVWCGRVVWCGVVV